MSVHDTPTPLTEWVRGTLTLTFASGVTVSHSTTLQTGADARKLIGGGREPDSLRWCDSAWFQYRPEEVVFSAFKPDEDGGWPLTADEGRTLATTHYRHGVLIGLLDFWESKYERRPVAYSPRALAALHQHAPSGASSQSWQRMLVRSKAKPVRGGCSACTRTSSARAPPTRTRRRRHPDRRRSHRVTQGGRGRALAPRLGTLPSPSSRELCSLRQDAVPHPHRRPHRVGTHPAPRQPRTGSTEVRVYRCGRCHRWHLTPKPYRPRPTTD